jgi:hypothetical protein
MDASEQHAQATPSTAPTFSLPPVPAQVRRVLLFVAMRSEAEPIARALGAHGGTARVGGAQVELLVPGVDPVLGVAARRTPSSVARADTRSADAARGYRCTRCATSLRKPACRGPSWSEYRAYPVERYRLESRASPPW